MSEGDRKLLWLATLRALRTKGDLGLAEPKLQDELSMVGHDLDLPVLQTELRELANRSWISSYTPEFGSKRWCITPKGEMVYSQG